MQTATNLPTLTVQLSAEDSDRLLEEAKRRQIDPNSLAEILLHDSLTELDPISQTQIESLEKLYKLREKTEILEFLEIHRFLMPVLLEAPGKIGNYFPDAQLFLECVNDLEGIDDDLLELAICINIEPDEAVDKLNKFQDDWWLNLSDKIRQPLCPILEYPHDF